MSYNISLACGCLVYVSCHPDTRVAHTRVLEARGAGCRDRRHEVGLRLYLWELLPQPEVRIEGAFTRAPVARLSDTSRSPSGLPSGRLM